jgi:hypothetical protein
MVVTTNFDDRVTPPIRHVLEPVAQPNPLLEGQNDPQPPPLFPPPGVGKQNQMAALEAQILTPDIWKERLLT